MRAGRIVKVMIESVISGSRRDPVLKIEFSS